MEQGGDGMSGVRFAFTGGEWNRMGDIRVDVEGYDRSARELVNFFVHSFGGLLRRPGTERMCMVNGGDARGMVRLMGMDVSDERRYVVAFGAGFVEVFRLDGSVAARLESPWEVRICRSCGGYSVMTWCGWYAGGWPLSGWRGMAILIGGWQ